MPNKKNKKKRKARSPGLPVESDNQIILQSPRRKKPKKNKKSGSEDIQQKKEYTSEEISKLIAKDMKKCEDDNENKYTPVVSLEDKSKKNKIKSDVWKTFYGAFIQGEDTKVSVCMECYAEAKIVCYGASSISGMKKHAKKHAKDNIKKEKMKIKSNIDRSDQSINKDDQSRITEFLQSITPIEWTSTEKNKIIKSVTNFVVLDGRPFTAANMQGFYNYSVDMYNLGVLKGKYGSLNDIKKIIPERHTISKNVLNIRDDYRKKFIGLIRKFIMLNDEVIMDSFTFDMWTSKGNHGYLGISMHFWVWAKKGLFIYIFFFYFFVYIVID